MKSSLKVNPSPVTQEEEGCFVCCFFMGSWSTLSFLLGKCRCMKHSQINGKISKGIGTDRVMYGGRKRLMQSMPCQICLKLLSLLWKEKQQRQNADLCDAHSSSKKMYLVFLSCYYSLSRNCIFQLEQVLASRNSCICKWLKDVVRNPLHLTPKHSLVVTVLLFCLHWEIKPHH